MDIFYYITSYIRIVPRKAIQYLYNYYNGIKPLPATRMVKQPMAIKMWNHVTNLYLDPTEIVPGVYLGNAYNASNYSTVQRLNIKTIVNVSLEIPNFFEETTDISYFQIPVKDDAEHHITEYIRPILNFLDTRGPFSVDNSVLIHCYMGSSRSASVVLMYLINKYNYTYDGAIAHLKHKRPIVNINTNFLRDIKEFFCDEPLII
jgi:protein-tyrosine phosphatase